jgi:excinuclease ABC subunit A
LVNDILRVALMRHVYDARAVPGRHRRVDGLHLIDKVVGIDQTPIGRTPRSNPATYTGVFDHIRRLFAATNEAKVRGYQPGRFSFNVKGGRCEACAGDGTIKIDMQFLPDVYVPCEVCGGQRYNRETLEVRYRGKNIGEVLAMSAEEALGFFSSIPTITRHMQTLVDVGLGYVRLGQAAERRRSAAARRSGSSSRRNFASAPPARPCTSWTSRRPVCTSRTSAACCRCCTVWSTRATR